MNIILPKNKGYSTAGQSPAPAAYGGFPQQSANLRFGGVLNPIFPHSLAHFVNKLNQRTSAGVPFEDDERPTLNMITHPNARALVYIHGGFYTRGNKLWYPLFLADYSEKNIFASIDYRLVRGKDNTIHAREMPSDVHDALLKIREIAAANGLAVADFVLAGHSAGAHIALLYGYKYFGENIERGINIAACVGLSAPSDYTDDFGWSSMPYYGANLGERLAALSWIGTELTGAEIKLTRYNWTAQSDYV